MTGITVWQTHGNYGFNWKHFFSHYMYDLLLLHLWKIKFATAMPRQFHKDTLRKKVLPAVD